MNILRLPVVGQMLLVLLAGLMVDGVSCGQDDPQPFPAGTSPRSALGQERALDYDFDQVSVARLQSLLGQIGVEVPVDLDGQLSGWVWVQRSAAGWFDLDGYRVEGELRSPALSINNWLVEDAQIRFGLLDGDWYVGRLSGSTRTPGDRQLIGQASIRAKLAAQSGRLNVSGTVNQIRIQSLLNAFEIPLEVENKPGNLLFAASAPLANAANPAAWNANAELQLTDIVTPWIETPGSAFAKLELGAGRWTLSEGRIRVAQQDLRIAGRGEVTAPFDYRASIDGDRIDTPTLLRQLKQDRLADLVAGEVTIRGTIDGDLQQLENARLELGSSRWVIAGQAITQLSAVAAFAGEGVTGELKSAEFAGGEITAKLAWPDLGQLTTTGFPETASVGWKKINLERIEGVALPVTVAGTSRGDLRWASNRREGKADWSVDGTASVNGFSVDHQPLGELQLKLEKSLQSQQMIGKTTLQRDAGRLVATVTTALETVDAMPLRATQILDYRAQGNIEQYAVAALPATEFSPTIPITANGSFDFRGTPEQWLGSGTASLAGTELRWNDRLIKLDLADGSFNQNEFRLHQFRLVEPEGRIAGSVRVRRDGRGQHELKAHIVGIQPAPYAAAWNADWRNLDGSVTLRLDIQKDATTDWDATDWVGSWQGSARDLRWGAAEIGELDSKGELNAMRLSGSFDGRLWGGIARGSITMPNRWWNGQAEQGGKLTADVSLQDASAESLSQLWMPKARNPVRGSVNATLTVAGESPDALVVDATLGIPRLQRRGTLLARDVETQIRFQDQSISIQSLSGRFADGRVQANGIVRLDPSRPGGLGKSSLQFSAQRVDASKLIGWLYPDYAPYYAGQLSYRGTATLDRGVVLSGSAHGRNGALFGLPIQGARSELTIKLSSDGQFERAETRQLHGTAAGGRFESDVVIEGGRNVSLSANGTVSRGKLRQISESLGFTGLSGDGTFDAAFDLNSKQIERLDRLAGGVRVDFENGDVDSIPILSQLDQFVPLAQFASANIESGYLNARLNQGQLKVTDSLVSSKAFRVATMGTANLDGSGLDLDMILQTGGSFQQQFARGASQRLVANAVVPVTILTDLNELVRNRSLFLKIRGRAGQPVIQAKPAQTAGKAFLQNFGRQALGIAPLATTADQ